MKKQIPNMTLLAISELEPSVAEIAIRPAPSNRTQTLVRLANLYGMSVLQDGYRLEIAVVSWNSPEDPLDEWEFVDQDDVEAGIYQSQNWQSVMDLVEQLTVLNLLPTLMEGG